MMSQEKRAGYNTVTPTAVFNGVNKAIAFYKTVFCAKEDLCLSAPDGGIVHCEMAFGDSHIYLAEPGKGWPEQSLAANIFVIDSDATFALAIKEGATMLSPVVDTFFGTREGRVIDPFGNTWTISTYKEEVSVEEVRSRLSALFAKGDTC